jgi:hypothetical protein
MSDQEVPYDELAEFEDEDQGLKSPPFQMDHRRRGF